MSFAIISSSLDARVVVERAARGARRAIDLARAIGARGAALDALARARMRDVCARM